MAKEIEHKYLVTNDLYVSMAESHCRMAQGYLNRDPERTVRVRIAGTRGYLTVKGKTVGDTRLEFEYEIPLHDAEEMIEMCDGKTVEKTRYKVPFEGRMWEVDVYEGRLSGLVVAEIELPESTRCYSLPPFCGQEVTGDARYFNSNL